jgi:HEAT repeat protein
VSKRVGDGTSTFFWYDRWLGDMSLRTRFSRLFDLSNNKLCTVADMFSLGWEEGGEAWRWRRRLWAWEEVLVEECRNLLNNIVLQTDISDRWQWNPDRLLQMTL